jgi:hypothetical protein
MHHERFGERKRVVHKPSQTLSQRGIPALDMSRFPCFLPCRCMLPFAESPPGRPSKNRESSALCERREEWLPTNGGRSVHFDRPRRSPRASRVFLPKAIQIQALFVFLSTKDQNSSHSRMLASGSCGSGSISVSLKGGSLAAFLDIPCTESAKKERIRLLLGPLSLPSRLCKSRPTSPAWPRAVGGCPRYAGGQLG